MICYLGTHVNSKRLWIYMGLGLVGGVGLVVAASSEAPPSGQTPPPIPGRPRVPRAPAPRRRLGPGGRILLFGDSFAQGLAAPLKMLSVEHQIPFGADGRKGTRMDQWAQSSWLPAALAATKPTTALVSLGTNDMGMPGPAITQPPHMKKIINMVAQAGAELVWIMPPTVPLADKGVRQMILSSGLPVFRSDSLVIPRVGDKIHPTAAGYAGWAGVLYRWLSERGAAPSVDRAGRMGQSGGSGSLV